MFKRINNTKFEQVDNVPHEDFQVTDTRVSTYLRKYGTGAIDALPSDSRTEVNDDRTTDEMLQDDVFEPALGTDDLDVLQQLQESAERFKAAEDEIELTKLQRQKFDNASKILNDPNSSTEAKQDAYRILEELMQKGKVKRARD